MKRFSRFTPEQDAYLIATHGRLSIAEQATALGMPRKRVADRRSRLVRTGRLARADRHLGTHPYRTWTDQEDQTVRDMLADGRSLAAIGQVIDRTPLAITLRLAARGKTVTQLRNPGDTAPLSLTAVAALFAVTSPVVRDWIRYGWLKPTEPIRRKRHPQGRRILFAVDVLLDFLAHQPTWFLWSAARMTDPDWRDEALRLRAQTPYEWLDSAALAARTGYAPHTVSIWFGEGRVPGAIKYGRYYVWSAHLEGWQAPQDRQDGQGRQQAAMQAWATRRAQKAS